VSGSGAGWRVIWRRGYAISVSIARRCRISTRSPDEIVGYDETGMW